MCPSTKGSKMKSIVTLSLLVLALGAAGCGNSTDSAPLATRSSAPIAFLRAQGTEIDPTTGVEPRRELVVIDSDGSNERTVRTPHGYDVESFSWSPDGRQLVLAASPPEDYRLTLFVANPEGSGVRELRRTPDHLALPVWSPRGDKIAWDNHDDGYHEIWVMNADGSDPRKLTPGHGFSDPVWSPDGRRIAYSDIRWAGGSWIYVMNADGSASKRVIRAESLPSLTIRPNDPLGGAPQWSAADQIGFYDGKDIWLANPDGSGRRRAIEEAQSAGPFRFAPSGRTIAFESKTERGFELFVSDISGGSVRRLTDNEREDLRPSFSPDGKSLVFEGLLPAKDEDPGPRDIYVINADGSGERNLTDSAVDESSPAWAPKN
jgi:Tol biopolymer transport system component